MARTDTSTTDATTSNAPLPVGMDKQSAAALANEMADVAAAMFDLLLLQSPAVPVHQDIPRTAVSEPLTALVDAGQGEPQQPASPSLSGVAHQTASPQAHLADGVAPVGVPVQPVVDSAPAPSVPVHSVPVPSIPLPAVPAAASPVSVSPTDVVAASRASVPVALPVPKLVGDPSGENARSVDSSGDGQVPSGEEPAASASAAVVAPVAPRTMAMLNEIAFLDD